jgi:cation transport regulator ChaB
MSDDSGAEEASEAEPFDAAPAHKAFSVDAFNSAWDLIEKENRSEADIEEMISLAHVSAWHWTKRQDVRPKNRAISAWQLSRVYSEAGRYEEAERYANRSLVIATEGDVGPVFTGYAYEALARLANETGKTGERDEWLALARGEADKVEDKLDRDQLLKDLEDLA